MVLDELTRTFNEAKATRNERYSGRWTDVDDSSAEVDAAVASLNKDGFAFLNDLLPIEQIKEIRATMESFISSGINISRPRKVVESGDWSPDTQNVYLSPDELAMGPDHYRKLINYIDIKEPFVNIPATLQIALNDTILGAAESYLGAFPGIGYVKMRRSLVNTLGDFDTTFFHFDGNSMKILKAFVYLNDVDEKGGPTTYARGSHTNRFPGWSFEGRYNYDQVSSAYGEENIIFMTAKAGDVVLGDPTGCHRGTKPIATDRDIIIINYVLHPEYGFVDGVLTMDGAAKSQITRSEYGSLSEKQAAAADFLEVISPS